MSIPKHVDPTSEDRKAFAPYNFVPLPDEIRTIEPLEDHSSYHADLLTGKLTCTLTTASPLYVRAARTLDEYTHKDDRGNSSPITPSDPFYGEAKEDLLIPGSSLRGMLRTMVEIIAQARLAPVTMKRLFYRTVDETSVGLAYRDHMLPNKVRPGFFHCNDREAWIEPALAGRVERSLLEEKFKSELYTNVSGPRRVPQKHLQHREVFVRLRSNASDYPANIYNVEAFDTQDDGTLSKGILVITGDMPPKRDGTPRKLREFVFVPVNTGKRYPLSEVQIDQFEDDDQITQYQQYAFPKGEGRQKAGGLKDGEPVFYLHDEDNKSVEAFGRAYMFRLPYKHSPGEMLPPGIRSVTELDLAEAMFGKVDIGEIKRGAIAGRIFITDARLQGKASNAILVSEPIYMKILSGPKPTTFQHYLTQSKPDNKDLLDHYDNNPASETVLRGHKLYWHKGNVSQKDFEADPNQRQRYPQQFSTPVKPVKSDQTFTFTIHFENLRPEELGALLWVLDKASSSKYRLKLGMGKPYGLGSVAITYTLHLSNRKDRYSDLFKGDQWNEGWLSETDVHEKFTDACQKFAVWLLKDEGATVEQVDNLERIQHLLALLTWEGHPPAEETGYMHLDEFSGRRSNNNPRSLSKRPVLPLPKTVLGGFGDQPKKTQSIPPHPVRPGPSTRLTRKEAPKVRPQPVDKPPADLKPGDVIQATVYDPAGGDVLFTPAAGGPEDYAIVRAGKRGTRRFRAGEKTLLYVLRISGDNENGWEFDCRPAEA